MLGYNFAYHRGPSRIASLLAFYINVMVGVLCMPVIEELAAILVWAYSVCKMCESISSPRFLCVMQCAKRCFEARDK